MGLSDFELPTDRLGEFRRQWRVTDLWLFGSALGENFGPDSDVDLLVRFADDTRWSLFDHAAMELELESILGRKVDLVSRKALEHSRNPIQPYFLRRGGCIMPPDRDRAHLRGILNAARKILQFSAGLDRQRFLAGEILQGAVIH